jgi:transcriptional regulator with XRE-family HTH domain
VLARNQAQTKHAVASRIHELREGRGITQAELSRLLKVTAACVSNWEKGKSFPSRELLPSLAAVLNTSVDYILSGSGGEHDRSSYVADPTISDVILGARKSVAVALRINLRRVHIVVD